MKPLLPLWYVLLLAVAGPALAAPPQAVAVALADARALPKEQAYYTRYLDLSHHAQEHRVLVEQAVNFHLNSLSREAEVKRCRSLAGGQVLAFDLRDYGIDRLVYGRLGSVQAAEPFFHVVLEVEEAGGYDNYGRQLPSRKVKKSAAAPWLLGSGIADLINLVDSQVPVLRADWLIWQTSIQKDRAAGYYDLLGLGNKEADFQKLIGANPAEAKRLKLETLAAVAKSGVAINNRGVTRLQALSGGYWLTQDFKTSTDKQNVARLLNASTEPPQGDASEQYGVLPNKLFAYGLFDKNGNRQDVVPPDIALDHKATGADRNIYAGIISCARCHVEGLRPVDDWVRGVFRGPLQLRSPDYEVQKQLQRKYLTDLPGILRLDRAYFEAAVQACNGLDVATNSRVYADVWHEFLEEDVDVARAARELGCSEQALVEKVKAYAAATPVFDIVIAGYAAQPPRACRREYFMEQYLPLQHVIGGAP